MLGGIRPCGAFRVRGQGVWSLMEAVSLAPYPLSVLSIRRVPIDFVTTRHRSWRIQ